MLTGTSAATKLISKLSKNATSNSGVVAVRRMSSTANVWVDKNTKVICQGFTGKQVGVLWRGEEEESGKRAFLETVESCYNDAMPL